MRNIWIGIGAMITVIATVFSQWAVVANAAGPAAPVNDPHYDKQKYLNQINVPQAWESLKGHQLNTVTVAVVDTGVDLSHPDLKDRLIEGKNILQPTKPPQDDYGHGTNVAGIIAAVRNNGKGIAGIAPNVNIMPVKAIDSDGHGEEEHLGEGIRYAVDNGADIIVLSLGLNLYSSYLSEIVSYAENKGVLLVAATGNEGKPVKYPAAYPTVVAVGGASASNEYKALSNYGPEVDLIAPWYVYTTANGGGYVYKEGTSMAAPQVAAVAALMLGVEPDLRPHKLRNRLFQSSQTLNEVGWSKYAGFGLLRADLALSAPQVDDLFEPNNTFGSAKPLSPVTSVSGAIQGKEDTDWFYIEPPYSGEIELRITGGDGAAVPIEAVYYGDSITKAKQQILNTSTGKIVRIPVGLNRVYLSLRSEAGKVRSVNETLSYRLETDFRIYRDPFEDNDKAYKAYVLPERSQKVTGTFHQVSDHDWYALQFSTTGTLRLKLDTDTPRIDPELYVASDENATKHTIDDGGEGEAEFSPAINVKPGRYYVRVRNVKALYPLPVTGEYTLTVDFEKKFTDGNEPNNRSYQATTVAFGSEYKGVFDSASDEDWYKFQLSGRSIVTVDMTGIPKDRYMYYTLYNANVKQKFGKTSPFGSNELRLTHDLAAGTYFIKLKTDAAYQDKQYGLRIRQEPLFAGFRDISDHWARSSIVKLVDDKVLKGYSDYRFKPNKTVTRAEAAVMIARAFQLKDAGNATDFPDVGNESWYGSEIAEITAAKIVKGYPDGTFKPDEPVTRAEMAVMAAIASGKKPASGSIRFDDLSSKHWASGYVNALVKENKLDGFEDGTFRPNMVATRAQFAALLHRIIK